LRGATPRLAFQAVARAALSQIESNARGVLFSDDPEFLHQLRVGMRRLRCALRAFRRLLDRKNTRRLIRSLRKLSPKLGAARDWDVLVARLETAGDREMLEKARPRRDAARRAARRVLDTRTFSRVPAQLHGLSTAPQDVPLKEFGAQALARAHAKLMKQARGIDWLDAEQRHALRIRLKRLRYSCEFFAPAFAAQRTRAYLAALKRLQGIFGELNDVAVGRRLLDVPGDEKALLRRLVPAWRAFERRQPFWRATA
jgi:CHAD domain-containing protein